MSAPCPNWAPTPRTGTSLIRSVYREQLDERRSWFDGLVFLSHKAVLYSACLSLSSACLSLSSFKRCAIISSFTAKTALLALMLWLCLACARHSTRGLRAAVLTCTCLGVLIPSSRWRSQARSERNPSGCECVNDAISFVKCETCRQHPSQDRRDPTDGNRIGPLTPSESVHSSRSSPEFHAPTVTAQEAQGSLPPSEEVATSLPSLSPRNLQDGHTSRMSDFPRNSNPLPRMSTDALTPAPSVPPP